MVERKRYRWVVDTSRPSRDRIVKKMAELMKAGAVMLSETCPVKGCNLPLFRLKSGEIVCPVHGKIVVVGSEEEAVEVTKKYGLASVLDKLEDYVIRTIDSMIGEASDPSLMIEWLEVVERIERIKKMIKEKTRGQRRASQ